jgi:hypothetical protein
VAGGGWNGTPFSATEIASIETVADLDQWARWFAVMTILMDQETNISNGQDDDYAAYFVPSAGGQRRMQLLAHDLDTVYGLGDTPQGPTSHGLYDMTAEGSIFTPLYPLIGDSLTTGNAAFRTKYLDAIRELYGTVFNADTTGTPNPPMHAFLDNHLAGWVPTGTISSMKTFATQRQAYLLGLIGSGAITPPAATSTATVTSPHGNLMISEVFANNVSAVNVGGLFPDIIELRNAGAVAIDLAGRSITDDVTVPTRHIFPGGTTVPAGGFLVLYADGTTAANHLPFSLSSTGETITLYESAANGGAVIDSISFGAQPADYSIGRTGAALTTWALGTPTPGAANNTVATFAAPGGVRINEWLGNSGYQVRNDFLELYNPAAQPVSLGGMAITDDFINLPTRRVLPLLSFMGPASFLRLDAIGSSATPGNAAELPFNIDSTSSWLALLGENGTMIDLVDVVSQAPNRSAGRSPDGAATYASFGLPTSFPTPGTANVAPSASNLALVNGLRISEVHYNPVQGNSLEFVEFRNIGTIPLNLGGVHFTEAIDFIFPASTLQPGGYLVIVKDLTSFQNYYGTNKPVAGVYAGALDNSGETIALTLPPPYDVNILTFEFKDTWYPSTDGQGYSLEMIDPFGIPPQDFDKKLSWGASGVLDGTPGSSGPPIITSSLTASGILGEPFTYQITAANGATSYNATGLPAGLSINTTNGQISGAPTAYGSFPVMIEATNPGGTGSATLNLSIAASGPLHHFTWSPVGSTQTAGSAFPVVVTAKDAQERTVAGFSGNVGLAAFEGASTSSTLVITEIFDQDPDQLEIQNVSGQTINTTGWFVIINNAGSGTNDVNTLVDPPLTQPDMPSSFTPGQILRVTDGANGPLFFWPNVPWSHTNKRRGWAMIVDNTGKIVDFLIWGYTEAEAASLDVTSNGFNLRPVNAGAWTGAPITHNQSAGVGLQRQGAEDTNTGSDFAWLPNSINTQNPGLTVPFGSSTPLPLSPPSATFSSGQWLGFQTIFQPASGAKLRADDGAAHNGLSNSFNVAAAPPDSDADGMPDTWETSNGLTVGVNDAALDKDGDGQANFAEYQAGTDPSNSQSLLRLISATCTPGGSVVVTWSAVPGKVYRVMHTTTLANWIEVPGTRRIATATAENTTFPDPAPAGSKAFFRVELMTGN